VLSDSRRWRVAYGQTGGENRFRKNLQALTLTVQLTAASDDTSIALGGSTRILVPAGVLLPDGLKVGMSLTVTAMKRDGVLYAEKIQRSAGN